MNPNYFEEIVQEKPLLVLNASAGSGKTYNLVRNYIRLLLNKDDPKEISQILAMTFTNKASTEMKERIIEDLDKLAFCENLNDSNLVETAEMLKLTPENTQKKAKTALRKILHQYEDFGVMTIDKFNLKLIRAFAKDLNLPDNFEISTNDELILDQAIDVLLSQVDENKNKKIYDLAFNFVKYNTEDEMSFDLKSSLKKVAKLLKQEKLFPLIELLQEQEFSTDDYLSIRRKYDEEKSTIENLQTALRTQINQLDDILNDLAGKTNTSKKIRKVIQLNFDDLVSEDFTENQISNIEKSIEKTDSEFLRNYLSFIGLIQSNKAEYTKLILFKNQFNSMALLKELAIRMEQLRTDESIIRVSEFNQLISELIKKEDAPFIYERLGNRYQHYFLDEFQDTSRLQFINLIPLIQNALSSNNFNFIVGDPKQSIYRFKNGVADQFVALPKIYNPENDPDLALKSNFFDQMGHKDGLEENWRSAKEIVHFNNRFFTHLKEKFSDKGKSFYEVISQKPRGKDGGRIEILTDVIKDKSIDVKAEINTQFLAWVKQCIDDGYKPSDICVLCSKNKDAKHFAHTLINEGYQVVSSDALEIQYEIHVQLAIQFIKWKLNRFNSNALLSFAHLYFYIKDKNNTLSLLFASCKENEDKTSKINEHLFYSVSNFPAEFIDSSFQNIYTLLVDFFNLIQIKAQDNTYIQQLLDHAYQFDLRNGADLNYFLSDFEENGKCTKVQLADNEHAIKVMSIHKSKGLEFPVVIIPKLDLFKKTNKDETLIQIEDSVLKTTLTQKEIIVPEISEAYELEEEDQKIDSYNLLYVAFTRAKDRLYGMELSKNESKNFEPVAKSFHELYPECIVEKRFHYINENNTEIEHEEKSMQLAYKTTYINDLLWFPEISLQSKKEQKDENLSEAIRLGNQFHHLMEKSKSYTDAREILQQGILKGNIDIHLESKLNELIHQAYQDKDLLALYRKGEHLNERSFIVERNKILRPDKLILSSELTAVIDFKTGEKNKSYEKQVKEYMQTLHEVGYSNIKGYLYYVSGEGLVEVHL